jgi:hypothetical protein
MQSRFSFFALGLGLLASLAVTAGNFFLLAPWLGLEEPDRLSTSIECFGAVITAVGVIYAGLNLREMSGTQSDLKSMQESQYIQTFLDQWNFDVEQCLIQMEKDGVANRTSDLLKIVWFFEKLDTAMRTCSRLRRRFRDLFAADYWSVSDFLQRNQIAERTLIPESELRPFVAAAERFGERPAGRRNPPQAT